MTALLAYLNLLCNASDKALKQLLSYIGSIIINMNITRMWHKFAVFVSGRFRGVARGSSPSCYLKKYKRMNVLTSKHNKIA